MTRYRCALAALMLFVCSAVVGCQESDTTPENPAPSPGADTKPSNVTE